MFPTTAAPLIVGALVFFVLDKAFSDYGTWYLLGLGALAIAITLGFKQGLWGWVHQRYGISLFPTRRWLASEPEHKERR